MMIPVAGQETLGQVALGSFQIGLEQPQPRSFALLRCNQKAQTSPNRGTLPHLWCGINNTYPPPKASATPFGALKTTVLTYQVSLKQQPPRRLCPGRYTQRVNS